MTTHADSLFTPAASTTSFRFMYDALQQFGINANALYEEIGLGANFLEDPNQRVPVDVFDRYWSAIEAKVETNNIGLLLVYYAHIRPINVPMMLLQASNTFGEGVARFIQFRQIMDPLYDWHLQVSGGKAHFYFNLREPGCQQRMECIAVYVYRFFQIATDNHWYPTAVSFQHEQPKQIDDHQRIFKTGLLFGQADNFLSLIRHNSTIRCLPGARNCVSVTKNLLRFFWITWLKRVLSLR